MRGNDLLDKMGLVEPAYVEEADIKPKRKRFGWVQFGTAAACLCLVVAGAIFAFDLINSPDEKPNDEVGVPIPNPDGTVQRDPMPDEFPEHPILKPGDEGYIYPEADPETEPEPQE